MRNLFTFLLLFLWALPLWAQRQPHELKPIAQEISARQSNNEPFTVNDDLFKVASARKRTQTTARIADASTLELQPAALQKLLRESPSNLRLTIPTNTGSVALQLYQVNIFSEGFYVATSDGQVLLPEGKHYRGIVDGNTESLAAISIFKDEVMGLIIDGEGNSVLGKIEGTENDYVLYNDRNLKGAEAPVCHTSGEHVKSTLQDPPEGSVRATATKCVRAYWEADYEIYQNKGSVSNVTSFLTGLFNQSKIIYDNDGISVTLQQIYVWTTSSPYSGQTNNKLGQFRSYRTTFNGDLAHLIHMDGGGGVAYVNALCSNGFNYGVSNINSSYANYPTYSWSVMVVTHEQGHILGSQHTHDCVWNGNNTAIDHCGGNSCWATEDAPAGGGTIMSYCHLTSTGINLSKGFGPQPKARITNAINAKGCLTGTCGGGGSTYYTITNRSSSKCVDVSNASTSDNANIQQWDCNGGDNQEFELVSAGSGYYYIKARHSGKCFRAVNGNLVQYTCNDGWWTEMFERIDAGSGYFVLKNRSSGTCLRVANSSGANGASIVLESCNSGFWSQQFAFSGAGSALAEPMESAAIPEERNNMIVLAPNPANSEVKVIFTSNEKKQVQINLRDMKGLELQSHKFNAVEGTNEFVIPLSASLSSGMYVINVDKKTAKLLITK